MHAKRPEDSVTLNQWGYRCHIRNRSEQNLLSGDRLDPRRVRTLGDRHLIKKGRTSTIYTFPLSDREPVYYKFDNCRGTYDFIKNIFRPSRAIRAWRAMNRLAELGFHVPRQIMAAEKRVGLLWHDSFLVTRAVEQAVSIDAYVNTAIAEGRMTRSQKRSVIHALADLVRALHDRRIYHADLKGANILIAPKSEGYELTIIDADRVHFPHHLSRRRRLKNLARINASFSSDITLKDRLRFYRRYARHTRYYARSVRREIYRSIHQPL